MTLIRTVVADAFATKCYLLAPDGGTDCVIVDPGFGVTCQLDKALTEEGLRPRAVLLTHGHLDHTFSVTQVSSAHRVPVYLHAADHWMLADPLAGLGQEFALQFEAHLPAKWDWRQPDDVRTMTGGDVLELAGLSVAVDHTPGHTRGSVMFNLSGEAGDPGFCLVGDTLYAKTIGRTDMPSGSRAGILGSLRQLLTKAPETVLLTGHGEDTTLAAERVRNPFVWQAERWNLDDPPPTTDETMRGHRASLLADGPRAHQPGLQLTD